MASIFIIIITLVVLLTSSTPHGNNNNQAIMAERRPSPTGIIKINQVHGQDGEFFVKLTIGDSRSIHSVRIDTDTDLIWTNQNCNPASSSYSKLPCSSGLCDNKASCKRKTDACEYEYEYADNLTAQVQLQTETFTFPGNVKVAHLGFGCSIPGNNDAGGLGLGRGRLSLVSQLNASVFAYCLSSYNRPEKNGFLWVGESPVKNKTTHGDEGIVTMRLVDNPPQNPSPYYVPLQGISVGEVLLDIGSSDFAVDKKYGSGGVVVDTGSTLTYLKQSVFDKVTKQVKNQIHNVTNIISIPQLGLKFCFPVKSKNFKFPKITFHFPENKNLTFPVENSYHEFDDHKSIWCLAMAPAPSSDHGKSSLGNIQQQNTLVVFDSISP